MKDSSRLRRVIVAFGVVALLGALVSRRGRGHEEA